MSGALRGCRQQSVEMKEASTMTDSPEVSDEPGIRKHRSLIMISKMMIYLMVFIAMLTLRGQQGIVRTKKLCEDSCLSLKRGITVLRNKRNFLMTTASSKLTSYFKLSRGYEKMTAHPVLDVIWPILGLTAKEVSMNQMYDSDVSKVLQWVERGVRPFGREVCTSSPATRHYWNCWKSLIVKDGILFKLAIGEDGSDEFCQCVLPIEMVDDLLYQMHISNPTSHLSKKKTKMKILQKFYWFGLHDDVNKWVNECDGCSNTK